MATIDRVSSTTDVQLEHWQYPVSPVIANDLVGLLRTEWTRTDYNWLEAMYGDYGDDLTIISVVARHHGRAVATATVLYSRRNPEVSLLGNVVTRRDFRGHGIGGHVIKTAVDLAKQAGCRACFLGTQASEDNVYRRHGFEWHRGVVMRHSFDELNPFLDPFEDEYFRPGQPTTIRSAHWGDLPGVTLLTIQPLQTFLLDYSRGLLSGQCEGLERCVSNFPLLMEDLRTRGGTMVVLTEPQIHRVFGFGTVTLGAGAGRRHTATIDLAVHDHYLSQAPTMIQWLLGYCRDREIQHVYAFAATVDTSKVSCLSEAGFSSNTKLRSAFVVNGQSSDVVLMEQELAKSSNLNGSTDTGLFVDESQLAVHSSHGQGHIHTGFPIRE